MARSWRHFALVGLSLALLYVIGVSSLKSYPATHEEWDSIKHLSTSQIGPINGFAETIESVIDKTRLDHAPGYFLLLNIWSRLTGLDLFTLRLFSIFIGLLGLALTYRLALLAGKPDTAADAALLAVFIAFMAYYGYTVRMYSLLPTLSVAVLWSYWKIRSRTGAVPRGLWLAFILASAAILWVHYFGTILLAAVGVYHLLFAPKNRRWRRMCLAAVSAGLMFAPWLPVFAAGLLTRDVPTSDALPLLDSLRAMASVYTNGLPVLAPVVFIAAAVNFRRLNQAQRYILVVVLIIALLMLIGNEFAPLLIARRIRYTSILALPWACALAIGLNLIPRWRFLRIPCLALWIAAYAAYADSDKMLLYTNWLTLDLHHVPHYQDLLYEPGLEIEQSDYIVSFHPSAEIVQPVHSYYDNFHGRWSGLKHIWNTSDGEPVIQTLNQRKGPIENLADWRFRAWVVYNPQQIDLNSMSAYSDVFLEYFKSCRAYVDKHDSVIELFGPRDVPCDLLTSSAGQARRIQYDHGGTLGNIIHAADSDRLIVYLWWAESKSSDYAYSLQIFDLDGAKIGPQTDRIIAEHRIYREDLDLSSLPAGEYVLKLVVYDAQSFKGQPGIDIMAQLRFERAVDVGSFTVSG